ncbi:hypothetical protein F984_02164 [Acinetobacter nosocomialis NIPH 2119]|nr:hypothetical protein F984_02164 [Acinetobacter nosocomialis NIPH 2119]
MLSGMKLSELTFFKIIILLGILKGVISMFTRKLTAFVLGNQSYSEMPLKNAVNDAVDIAKALTSLGFTVTLLTDAKIEEIDEAILTFKDNLNSNDVGLFYFAGHGIQLNGDNYITAVDTSFYSEGSVLRGSCSLSGLMEEMAQCSNKTNIIILDACRDNPLSGRSRGGSSTELAPIYAPKGTLIAFSTSPGERASDGKGKNGAFTEALLRHITAPDLTIEEVLKRTRNTLSSITNGKQTSWEHTSLTGEFCFKVSLSSTLTYHKDVIADKNFTASSNKQFNEIINGLRSHNWYLQNPAIAKLDESFLENLEDDMLFLLGRNIYQSAVGSSDNAINFLNNFSVRTKDLSSQRRKALLDGILFEIFFDNNGEIRENYKISQFNNVFSLIEFDEYKESFNFIYESLLGYANLFYVIPGKKRKTLLDIRVTLVEEEEYKIESISLEGSNILKLEDGIDQETFNKNPRYYSLSLNRLKNKLSETLVIPKNLLELNFIDAPEEKFFTYLLPRSHTLEK